MNVKGIASLGVRTSQVPEMRGFLTKALGLDVAFEEPDFVVLRCPSGDKSRSSGRQAHNRLSSSSATTSLPGF